MKLNARPVTETIDPDSIMLMGHPKRGKAQEIHEPVLTNNGWIEIGKIRPGDRVFGPDGKTHGVIAIMPQGNVPLYRVGFDDLTYTITTAEHEWAFSHRAYPARARNGVLETQELHTYLLDKNARLLLPGCQPIQFDPPRTLPVDPYALGLLLGDGCISGASVRFANPSEELHQAVIEGMRGTLGAQYVQDNCLHSTIKGIMPALYAMGLDHHLSVDKFLPTDCLFMNVKDRFALLQGLLDTDGSQEGLVTKFNTSSTVLAQDVAELVRSLGGRASISSKEPTFTYKGVRKTGHTAYRVGIRLPNEFGCPFRLDYKAAAWNNGAKKRPPYKRIVSVEPAGNGEAVCISLDSDDQLYITRDYIVTHNSTMAASICEVEGYEKVLMVDLERGAKAFARMYPKVDVIDVPLYDIDYFSDVMNEVVANDGSGYDCIIVDTMSTAQKWKARDIGGGSKLSYDGWYALGEWTMGVMNMLHYMEPLGISIFHVTTKENEVTKEIWTLPKIDGGAKDSVASVPDLVLYLDVVRKRNKPPVRVADFVPAETRTTGNRFSWLPEVPIADADMSVIFSYIRGDDEDVPEPPKRESEEAAERAEAEKD